MQVEPRLDYERVAPEAVRALSALQATASERSGLEPSLLELIRIRISQMNGCAYCLDFHFQKAKSLGESEQRLYLLGTWQDAPVYTQRERAGLAWAEAVTRLGEDVGAAYASALAQFSEAEIVNLTLAIVAINAWNRFNVSFRKVPSVRSSL